MILLPAILGLIVVVVAIQAIGFCFFSKESVNLGTIVGALFYVFLFTIKASR